MRRVLIVTAIAAGILAAPASGYHLEGGRWATHVIPYYTETSAYAWSVDTAAYAWNTSGANVRFVKTSKRYAKVLVGIRWFKHAGDARVQRVDGVFVGAQVGIQSGHDRYEMALIVAHELGHVLGLEHRDDTGCTIMRPDPRGGPCEPSQSPLGSVEWGTGCIPAPTDVARAAGLYGGTPAAGSPDCR